MATTTRSKSDHDEQIEREARLVNQIDTLQSIAKRQKSDQLGGEDFYKDTREFVTLLQSTTSSPIFRPQVSVPELQLLGVQEAIEVTDIQPQIYLTKNLDTLEQDKVNEAALRAQWRESKVNLNVMLAMLMSWFTGTSFLQIGWDPLLRNGRGNILCPYRDPETVFADPYAFDDEGMQYVVLEDYYWIDQVRDRYPLHADRIRSHNIVPPTAGITSAAEKAGMGLGLEVPAGPMNVMIRGMPGTSSPGDSRVRLRTLFTRDPAKVRINSDDKGKGALELSGVAQPTFRPRYPRGRMIVECERVILYDGENPFLHGQFPIVRFIGMPSLYGFWAPPPVRYTKNIQTLAERFYTQLFENAIRLNNGVWFIDENTGIDIERFGGLPGEVQGINANATAPTAVYPQQMPQAMFELPTLLMALQRQLQGFPDQRQGKAAAGNTSAPMFEGAIAQAHVLTRGRARLMEPAIARVAYLMFCTMAQYYTEPRKFVDFSAEGMGHVDWTPINRGIISDYQTHLDPASLTPMSAVMLRNMVPMLRNMGLLDVATALEMLLVPNRNEVLKRLKEEQQQAAQLAAVTQAQKGQRRAQQQRKK